MKYRNILFLLMTGFSCEIPPDSPPVASFLMSKSTAEVNEVVQFTSRSREASGYSWDFGDGQGSEAKNPEHFYSDSGTYRVMLTASNQVGIDDTIRNIIIVLPEILWPAPGEYSGNTADGGIIYFKITGTKIDKFTGSFFADLAGNRYEFTSSFEFGRISKTDTGFIVMHQGNILTGVYSNDTISGSWKHDYGEVEYTAQMIY
jgi:PKD repeat protein